MAAQVDPNIGQLLLNRYRLAKLIGQGSMGKVYLAKDQTLDDVPVAAKFLAQALVSKRMTDRFAKEARTGAKLGHRSNHIVRVIDYGVHHSDVPFYIMEYMEQGSSLSDLILDQPLSVPRFLNLMRQVCLGLQSAHNGISLDGQVVQVVHRDIKPSNVFVIPDPALGELAKVLDFGIAQFLSDQEDGSQTRTFMGTLAYASPEQIESQELYPSSDIYSLGITMFEVLTGKMPIEPSTNSIGSWYKAHRQQRPRTFAEVTPDLQLPPALVDMIMSCMAKDPKDRPQDMAAMLSILEALEKQLQAAPSPPPSEMEGPSQTTEAEISCEDEFGSQETPVSEWDEAPEPFQATQVPEIPNPQQRFYSVQGAGWSVQWPADKPLAEIVFPKLLQSDHQEAVALWVMLSREEVQKRSLNTRHTHFLCTLQPHPMLLWITTLYNPTVGARWLPCYIDLKQERGQYIATLLGQTGYFPLIFFAFEEPEQPADLRSIPIDPGQRLVFQDWVKRSQQALSLDSPTISKQLLKRELETKVKPMILQKLAAVPGKTVIGGISLSP